MNACRVLTLGAAVLLLATGCSEWQYNVTRAGVAFSQVRSGPNGQLIGRITSDTVVHNLPCKQGWLHLHPNGVPAAFTAAREIDTGKYLIPADTWVFQKEDGVVTVCAFPRDTVVQGHLCRGTGGPKGVQAAFHPDGSLRQFYPPLPVSIDGVSCDPGLVKGWIELHPNGRLKSCLLAADLARDGRILRQGERIKLDLEGKIAP